MRPLQLIGYWRVDGDVNSAYPHPSDWVDWGWDPEERNCVGAYLASGTIFRAYRGLSPCRICGRPNGAVEYTDGTYVWPEGLAHYVDEHGVRLPDEVVAHAMSRCDWLENVAVSEACWKEQPKVRGDSVSSASSNDPDLRRRQATLSKPVATTQHFASDDDPGDGYLNAASIWLVMAELLVEGGGHRILKTTARATLSAGQAEFSWTEVHHLTAADYTALVDRARELVGDTTRVD